MARKRKQGVFVDTGAWIALAVEQDPLHEQALHLWNRLLSSGVKYCTSIPVVLETFTFLERNTRRDVALAWKKSIHELKRFQILPCTLEDLNASWAYFERRDLHKLSAVDATSFVIMARIGVRTAFAFDHHFPVAGFRLFA